MTTRIQRGKSSPRRTERLSLTQRLRRVKLFLCDVDGILTNATVFMGDGREFKQFHIRDEDLPR